MADKKAEYFLGTDEQQKWQQNYTFAPRGIGFAEPGLVPLDAAEMSAYNIAKSVYQIHPEVFNMAFLVKETGMDENEIKKRMLRLYNEHLIMFVMNPATQVVGWGLYYWLVKLKDGTPAETKQKLANWFQAKDDICTGYECEGDFDFFNGNHMRVLDNLLTDVIEPWKFNEEVEYVHLCPVRRDLRESHVNMWDAPKDTYRKDNWSAAQLKKLLKHQNLMDEKDIKLFVALNKNRLMSDYFDYEVLAKLSGLDAKEMEKGISEIVDKKKIIVPLFYLNYKKLNLKNHYYIIRMFQNVPSYRKAEIVDELSKNEELNSVIEFTDSFYDVLISAYTEISDLERISKTLNSYSEIEEIKEADATKQFRRWVCRLDDENDFWEECVFTDDFLEDRTDKRLCCFDNKEKEEK